MKKFILVILTLSAMLGGTKLFAQEIGRAHV